MRTPGDEGRVHIQACPVCTVCGRCRWVATSAKATHVIEVRVKVRHFCEHHGIPQPASFVLGVADGS